MNSIKNLLKKVVRRHETWAIGIYESDRFLQLKPAARIRNPVLTAKNVTDIKADFVADPFMLWANGLWYMFFEVLNAADHLGYIALATSPDGFKWTYQQVVLQEPFHLSYPYVFSWNDVYYMIPETYQTQEVRLYKSDIFPYRWSLNQVLLQGADYVDSSLIRFDDRWWLFSSTIANDRLYLYSATSLWGTWNEHPCSPIVVNDPHIARPAGRVVNWNGQLIRFAQDDDPDYGRQVWAFEITQLTTSRYQEQRLEQPILQASGFGWNATGMHHLDLHPLDRDRWIACVDGKGRDRLSIR